MSASVKPCKDESLAPEWPRPVIATFGTINGYIHSDGTLDVQWAIKGVLHP